MTAVSYVYRDSIGQIIKKDEKNVGDILVLVAEMLASWHVMRQAIQDNYSKVIIQSDLLIVYTGY